VNEVQPEVNKDFLSDKLSKDNDLINDGEATTSNFDPEELQLLFEVHTGRFVTIHEFELNVQPADSTTYFDKNMPITTTFQTIS